MGYIPEKTLEDVEFPQVLGHIAEHAQTFLGKQAVLNIRPIESIKDRNTQLRMVSEILLGTQNKNEIPPYKSKNLKDVITLLRIENSVLTPQQFNSIVFNNNTANNLLRYIKKNNVLFPYLNQLGSHIKIKEEVSSIIFKQIDPFDKIRDNASSTLSQLRKKLTHLKIQMNRSFQESLNNALNKGYLDEIKETVHGDKRVLAVKAQFRKKILGATLGSSRNRRIVYVEPIENANLQLEYQNLKFEEKQEETQILADLSNTIRPYCSLFSAQQSYLIKIDLLVACSKYADDISGVLPQISPKPVFELYNAYHPLLLISNRKQHLTTVAQNINVNDRSRIIVISGPNAGGKSITLKTVGLLQIMIQSGLLVPVDRNSLCGNFNQIITDIGDNQSIENHLSTYSYRLKNMRTLLKKADDQTLFLIDEFGTGSDPDLGGALAEAILEKIYLNNSYGIITTHYTNLKLMAHKLDHMVNANMLFNTRSLSPLFKLEIGDAGSSFTFEVAEKIGIPYTIINKAKKKISKDKLAFDSSIAKLQKEKTQVMKTKQALEKKEILSLKESKNLEELNQKLSKKLKAFEILYQEKLKFVNLGEKFNKVIHRYEKQKNKKLILTDLLHLLDTEVAKKAKRVSGNSKVQNKKIIELLLKDDLKKRAIKKSKKKTQTQPTKSMVSIKVGDVVRISDGESTGTVEKIVKDKAFVNYGQFITQVDIIRLELANGNK